MRKLALLCGLALLLSIPAIAQDLPKFDVFGGYSYVRVNIEGDIHSNLNGGSGAVAFYPSKHFGVVGDFGGYKLSTLSSGSASCAPLCSVSVSGSVITYLFGPRIRFGGEKATPFAQVLFGGAHIGDVTTTNSTFCGTVTPPCKILGSSNAFAMTLGGGLDVKVARHFSFRGQGEFLLTRFQDPTSSTGAKGTQKNARISVGIVIH
jgi:opacity protein-like surface antigen